MRKGLLSTVASALVGAGSALAQTQYYLPNDGAVPRGGPVAGMPVLLSADPVPPAQSPAAAPVMSGGTTGLVPGVDCLPESVPQHPRFYGDIAYMVTWIRNGPNPGPLAIASPVGAPLLGPATRIPVGGREIEFDSLNGVKATVGAWLNCDATFGVEASGFVLQQQTDGQAVVSNGAANTTVSLNRPFVDLDAGGALGTLPIGGPGIAGGIVSRASTRLWGAEGNFVLNWRDDCQRRVDLLAGFTYIDLQEGLGVSSVTNTTVGGIGAPAVPVNLAVNDAFDTRNQFYGGQVGMRSTMTRGKLSLIMTGKVALGLTHEAVDRSGNSLLTSPAFAPVAANTGFLVQSSNAGRLTTDRFAFAMPSQILLSYQVTDHMSAFIGYDFIYISSTARPGEQLDLSAQTNPMTGAPIRPAGGMRVDEFWANSGLLGVSFKF